MKLNMLPYLVLSVLLAACSPVPEEGPEPAAPVKPVVEFSLDETDFEVDKFTAVTFAADISTPAPVDCGWWVNGEKACATPEFVYDFVKAGAYVVEFRAWNDAGEVSRLYNVTVVGVPLTIDFSTADPEINIYGGQSVSISSTVTGGDFDVVKEWTVDGKPAGDGSTFSKEFPEDGLGTYELRFKASNSDGFVVERSWTISVTEMPLLPIMYEDFENATGVPSGMTGVSGALSVVANPHVTAANPSAKVLYDNLTGSSGSGSGYVQVVPSPDKFIPSRRPLYSTVRVKVWMGTSNYFPYLQTQSASHKRLPNRINGQPLLDPNGSEVAANYFTPYTTAQRETIAASVRSMIRTDEWNVLEFDLSTWTGLGYDTLDKVTSMQFKPMCKVDGSNMAAGAANQTDNLRSAYVDDFEFIPAGWNE